MPTALVPVIMDTDPLIPSDDGPDDTMTKPVRAFTAGPLYISTFPEEPATVVSPVENRTEPVLPESVVPDPNVTSPLSPETEEYPVVKYIVPVDVLDVPVLRMERPVTPVELVPDVTNTLPLSPEPVVPELSNTVPLMPVEYALEDLINTTPEEVDIPAPLAMVTLPPVSDGMDLPA